MTAKHRLRFPKSPILGGTIAVLLAGVTLLPSTGWLVRQQAQIAFSGSAGFTDEAAIHRNALAELEKIAAAHPDDFPLQMALALRRPSAAASRNDSETVRGDSKLAALHGLEAAYSDQPLLYAAILRDLSRDAVHLKGRPDRFDLRAQTSGRTHKETFTPVRPEVLAEWARAASRGEEIDPDNAFFPLMQSVGLFAQNRDAEAVAAIRHAATLPRFDDYMRCDVTGAWSLLEAGQGGHAASLPRLSLSAAVLMPHYALLDESARLAAVDALHQEQSGNTEAGFAIRQALLRAGARIRTDSNWTIGNHMGSGMAVAAQSRPGGAPPISGSVPARDRAALKIKQYKTYLTRIGHSDEIAWVKHEETARQEIRTIVHKGLDSGPSSIANAIRNAVLWGVGIVLLSSTLSLLLFGALASQLRQTEALRRGNRLPLTTAGPVGLAIGALLFWLSGSLVSYANGMKYLLGVRPDAADPNGLVLRLISLAFLMGLPTLLWLALSIRSRVRGISVSVGVVRGFARAALPTAAALSLLYVGVVGVTAVRENAASEALAAAVQHEGRACAARAGLSWPTYAPDSETAAKPSP